MYKSYECYITLNVPIYNTNVTSLLIILKKLIIKI